MTATLIALETSTEYCSVALLHGASVHTRHVHAGQTHSAVLLPMVAELLAEADLTLAGCDAIVFGAGPGSFTGLRIACSVAQGLAWGAQRPVIPVCSLEMLAEGWRMQGADLLIGTLLLCALDDRMGEVYWALLEWDGADWQRRVSPSLAKPEQVVAEVDALLIGDLRRIRVIGCGNAFFVFASIMASAVVQVADEPRLPHAGAALSLARRMWVRGEVLPAHRAMPLYVRDQVALTTAARDLIAQQKRQHPPADAVEPLPVA